MVFQLHFRFWRRDALARDHAYFFVSLAARREFDKY
jgi:hypothetical protein